MQYKSIKDNKLDTSINKYGKFMLIQLLPEVFRLQKVDDIMLYEPATLVVVVWLCRCVLHA